MRRILGHSVTMQIDIFQLDAFTSQLFTGNPAAVMPLPAFPPDKVLLALAQENNLSETAFLVAEGEDYRLRWFTPAAEVPLCGHATLASAAVVMERLQPQRTSVVFHTASGALTVVKRERGYVMDFPVRPGELVSAPVGIEAALGSPVLEVQRNDFNYLARLPDAGVLRALTPDMAAILRLDRPGVIVTAPGDKGYDFISRYFAPAKGVPEDPVTGSAHCMLAPYWADRLGRQDFRAFQASRRGGEVICRLRGDRVELEGACVFYLKGVAELPLQSLDRAAPSFLGDPHRAAAPGQSGQLPPRAS